MPHSPLLCWQSQQNSIKLRLLAEQIVHDYLALTQAEPARTVPLMGICCSPRTSASTPTTADDLATYTE